MQPVPAEVGHAFRRLIATPALSIASVLTLALGIGSAVVMVDVLDRLLLRAPAHVADPDRVVRGYLARGTSYMSHSGYGTFEALAALHDELDAVATYFAESLSLGRGARARRIETVAHSGAYFTVLGVQPEIGSFNDAANPAREDAAVISYALWQQEFGGSRDVLGKALHLGLDTYAIVAVAPRGFRGIDWKPADVWLPLVPRARRTYGGQWKQSAFFLQAIARLRRDANRDRANEHATALYRGMHPDAWDKDTRVVLGDLRAARAPGAPLGTRVEVLVAGMSVVVLLITCGNVANLLLVRGLRREREFMVKTAIGASRVRLVREVLIEAAVLAAAAGAASLFVVMTGGTVIRRLFLSPITALDSPINVRVVGVTVGVCAVSAFALGLAPAFRLTMRRALAPAHAAAMRPSRVLDLFSGLQVALSVPLIAGAGLFALSLWNARHQDFGMQTDRVTVLTTNLFEVGRPFETHAVHRQIQARLAKLPQVDAVAMIHSMPMQSRTSFLIQVPGRHEDGTRMVTDADTGFNGVDPSFFRAMRMRLVDGRPFTDEENRKGAHSVAVVTESMARSFWPGERAVGKCFYMNTSTCTDVVGIVKDARLFPSIRPTNRWASAVYLPVEQYGGGSDRALLVRTNEDPAHVLDLLRREAQAAAPDAPYIDVHAFDDIFVSMLRPWRLGSTVFVAFGAISMLVAAVGLAVVGAYGVTRRTREIGIRSALGADPRRLVGLMVGHNLLVASAGLAVGIALAWAGGRLVEAQLFNVQPSDARVFTAVTLVLFGVSVIAAWIPARRAARIDPVTALRAE
jgi:putative ABC transport system permease protein